MSAQPEYQGELPPNAVKIDSYSVGYGYISQLDETGGRTAPALFIGTNEGLGPLLIMSIGHGLDFSEQIHHATIAGALEFDPKLRELKAVEEKHRAHLERITANNRQRLRVLLVFYAVWVVVEVVIGSVSSWKVTGTSIVISLALFGLAFLLHSYSMWWVEWRTGRIREKVPDGE